MVGTTLNRTELKGPVFYQNQSTLLSITSVYNGSMDSTFDPTSHLLAVNIIQRGLEGFPTIK